MRMIYSGFFAALLLISTSGCMASPPVPVGRSDLAAVYLEFEQAYATHPPTDEKLIAEVNRGFDRASLLFFNGQTIEVIREIQALLPSLPNQPATPAARVARALKVTLGNPTIVTGSTERRQLRITSMYPVEEADARKAQRFTLSIRAVDGTPAVEIDWSPGSLTRGFVDSTVDLGDRSNDLRPGVYTIEVASADGAKRRIGRLQVVTRSLDERRAENLAALDQIRPSDGALQSAVAICRARNAQLVDEPAATSSLPLLVSMEQLASEVQQEIAALRDGRNPYRRRVGDYWRIIGGASGEYACRVYAPREAAGNEPLPLVIALHGAGGDENMFFEGYGAGVIKTVADERRLIVAAPLSYPFTLNPGLVDRLIETLEFDYAIDRNRVYLVGHSLGVGAINSILSIRAPRFAAVAALAGALSLTGAGETPPILVFSAELDPLASPTRIRAAVDAAREDGYEVELREVRHYGHTLVVGAKLREALEWLVARGRATE